jgi:hypothetical protein
VRRRPISLAAPEKSASIATRSRGIRTDWRFRLVRDEPHDPLPLLSASALSADDFLASLRTTLRIGVATEHADQRPRFAVSFARPLAMMAGQHRDPICACGPLLHSPPTEKTSQPGQNDSGGAARSGLGVGGSGWSSDTTARALLADRKDAYPNMGPSRRSSRAPSQVECRRWQRPKAIPSTARCMRPRSPAPTDGHPRTFRRRQSRLGAVSRAYWGPLADLLTGAGRWPNFPLKGRRLSNHLRTASRPSRR